MTFHGPLWLQNGSTSALDDRAVFALLADQPGVDSGNDLKVTQRAAGANMSVDIAPGVALIPSVLGAPYVCQSDAVVNLPIGASPPSGQDRQDLVVATVRDAFTDGGTNNDWYLQVVPGVPAAQGASLLPSTPLASLALASVLVGGGVSTVTGFAIPDLRVPARRPAPTVVGVPLAAQYATGNPLPWASTAGPALLVSVPPFPVVVSAVLTGQVAPASNAPVVCGWRVDVSFNNGSTWTTGTEVQGLTPNTLTATPVTNQAIVSGTSSGVIQVRAMIRQIGGATYSQFTNGTLIAIVSSP